MVHEIYDSLFFPSYLSFPLEGKSREAGKGVRGRASIGCAIAVLTANRRPVSFLFLTFGHTFGVRVQKVQRVVVAASPQVLKKGAMSFIMLPSAASRFLYGRTR